jgi:hypothetical protein
MNNRIAKKIRKIIPPTDEISRRNYRRAKKKYTRLSEKAKPLFLANLAAVLSQRSAE